MLYLCSNSLKNSTKYSGIRLGGLTEEVSLDLDLERQKDFRKKGKKGKKKHCIVVSALNSSFLFGLYFVTDCRKACSYCCQSVPRMLDDC